MKTFKFSFVLRNRENTDVFITLDENIYGIHLKRVNSLYIFVFDGIANTSLGKRGFATLGLYNVCCLS